MLRSYGHAQAEARYTPPQKHWWHQQVPWKMLLMITVGVVSFRVGISIGNATPHRNVDGQITSNWRYAIKQRVPGLIPYGEGGCVINGCAGYECVDANSPEANNPQCNLGVKATQDSCYRFAICQRQPTGNCGWTHTPAYQACMTKTPNERNIDLNQSINQPY